MYLEALQHGDHSAIQSAGIRVSECFASLPCEQVLSGFSFALFFVRVLELVLAVGG